MAKGFVGTRPLKEGDPIFGRDSAIERVTQSLLAERIVLVHAPSGAGKTSLIRAGVIPQFRRRGFVVSPSENSVGELIRRLTREGAALRSLSISDLERLLFGNCLDTDQPRLVVFDQCEELFAVDQQDASAFVDAASMLCSNRMVWVVFSIREDYVGMLLALADRFPGSLRERVRLSFLTKSEVDTVVANCVGDHEASAEQSRRQLNALIEPLFSDPGILAGVSPMMVQVVASSFFSRSPDVNANLESVAEAGNRLNLLLTQHLTQVLEAAAGTIEARRGGSVEEGAIRVCIEAQLIDSQDRRIDAQGEELRRFLLQYQIDKLEENGVLVAKTEDRYCLAHDRYVAAVRRSNDIFSRNPSSTLDYIASRWKQIPDVRLPRPPTNLVLSALRDWKSQSLAVRAYLRSLAFADVVGAAKVAVAALFGVAVFFAIWQFQLMERAEAQIASAQDKENQAKDTAVRLDQENARRKRDNDVLEQSLRSLGYVSTARMKARSVAWAESARAAAELISSAAIRGDLPNDFGRLYARMLAHELMFARLRIDRSSLRTEPPALRSTSTMSGNPCGFRLEGSALRFIGSCASTDATSWRLVFPNNAAASAQRPSTVAEAGPATASGNAEEGPFSPRTSAAASQGAEGERPFVILQIRPPLGEGLRPLDGASTDSSVPRLLSIQPTGMSEHRIRTRPAEYDSFSSWNPDQIRSSFAVVSKDGLIGVSTLVAGRGRSETTQMLVWRLTQDALLGCLTASECKAAQVSQIVHVGAGNWSISKLRADAEGALTVEARHDDSGTSIRFWSGVPPNVLALPAGDRWLKFMNFARDEVVVVSNTDFCVGLDCRDGSVTPLLGRGQAAYPLALFSERSFPSDSGSPWRGTVVLLSNGQVVEIGDDGGRASFHRKNHLRTTSGRGFESFGRSPGDPEVLFYSMGSSGIAFHRRAVTSASSAPLYRVSWDPSGRHWVVSRIRVPASADGQGMGTLRVSAVGGVEQLFFVALRRGDSNTMVFACDAEPPSDTPCDEQTSFQIEDPSDVASLAAFKLDVGYLLALGLESGQLVVQFVPNEVSPSHYSASSQVSLGKVHSGNAVVSLADSGANSRVVLISGGTERSVAVHTLRVETSGVKHEAWGYIADLSAPLFNVAHVADGSSQGSILLGTVYGEVLRLSLDDMTIVDQLCGALSGLGTDTPACTTSTRN